MISNITDMYDRGEMMKKNMLANLLISVLIFIGGGEILQAQQSSGVNDMFSVYSSEDRINRDMTNRDMRFMNMKGTNTTFSLLDYTSLAQWNKQKKFIHDQILISAGLWPRPPQTPLHAHVFDKIIHKNYSIEKVYIEPYPNFYLAGNLYRPRGEAGPFPGILAPHGHWKRGRLENSKRASVPSRAIHFAKAGYMVFTYDMVGYGDTRQIGHDFADGDSLAQLWGINLLGLQLRDSKRALEFLRSRPTVDSSRIGITGASGGGTQTFLLDATTDKEAINVSAPVNMISTIMQGGGLCENAPGLRLNTFNVEIAGMFAPRPQLMVSDTHDWTKNTPWTEYPMMRTIYKLHNAAGHVDYRYFDYRHNYNKASREAVYRWFHQWMPGEALNYPIREQSLTVEPDSNLLVFLNQVVLDRDRTFKEMDPSRYHNLPARALQMDESTLKQYLKKSSRQQLNKYWPTNQTEWPRFDSLYGNGYRHILASSVPKNVDTKVIKEGAERNLQWTKMLLARADKRAWIPAILFEPSEEKDNTSKAVTLVLTPTGKSGVANPNGKGPNKLVQKLIDRNQRVMAIDVFNTGEHILPEGVPTKRNEDTPHFTTFNKTDTQQRVQDILTTGKFLKTRFPDRDINLVALDQAGIWGILASPLTSVFSRIICDENQLDVNKSNQWTSYFIPGLLKYGGIQTALILMGKQDVKVTIYNVNAGLTKMKAVNKILDHSDNLSVNPEELTTQNIINFLDP